MALPQANPKHLWRQWAIAPDPPQASIHLFHQKNQLHPRKLFEQHRAAVVSEPVPRAAPLNRRAGAAGEVNAPVVGQGIAHGPAEPPQHWPPPQPLLAPQRDNRIHMPVVARNERSSDELSHQPA
jgi:hypothetical protein